MAFAVFIFRVPLRFGMVEFAFERVGTWCTLHHVDHVPGWIDSYCRVSLAIESSIFSCIPHAANPSEIDGTGWRSVDVVKTFRAFYGLFQS